VIDGLPITDKVDKLSELMMKRCSAFGTIRKGASGAGCGCAQITAKGCGSWAVRLLASGGGDARSQGRLGAAQCSHTPRQRR